MPAAKDQVQTANGSTPDITIFRGWKDPGKYVWSPFVIKLEARLRFAGVRYNVDAGSIKTSPKGKIPYVECSTPSSSNISETTVAQKSLLSDSTLIISTMAEWNTIPDLNAAMQPEDRAKDLGLRALLENKLYHYHGFERWTQNYYTMRDHILWSAPYPVKVIVGLIIYRKTIAMLHGEGTGRFSPEEIAMFRSEIWESFSDLLRASKSKRPDAGNEHPFWVLGGNDPTEVDFVLFGFIVSVLICAAAPDSQKVVKSFPILVEYADRIHDQYFPDYEKWSL